MDSESDYIIIFVEDYREAFYQYHGKEFSMDSDYLKFDTYLGLKYIGNSSFDGYRFVIKNKKKWFLAKLRYGF